MSDFYSKSFSLCDKSFLFYLNLRELLNNYIIDYRDNYKDVNLKNRISTLNSIIKSPLIFRKNDNIILEEIFSLELANFESIFKDYYHVNEKRIH